MVKIWQVGIYSAFKFRTYIFISHVNIDDIHFRMDFCPFRILLLYDTPNLVDRKCKKTARDKLSTNSISSLGKILRSYVSITNCKHCCGSPIEWKSVLNNPLRLFQRFPINFKLTNPATAITVLNRTSCIRNIKETASSHITKHENLRHQQK